MSDLTNEFPLFIDKLVNETGTSLSISFPPIDVTEGLAGTRIVPLPFLPGREPDPAAMLELTATFGSEEQSLFVSYHFDGAEPPVFFLDQVDSNGESSSVEMNGNYKDGDVTLNFNLEGGILIIGTVEVDIEPVLA